MASRLIWLVLLLGGCGTFSSISTDEALQMQRNAVLAYDSGENARAEALYQGLARVAPNDPETWLRLGNLYARAGRPDDAAEAYQRSLLLNPSDHRLWYNLGIIRQRQAHAAFIQVNQMSRPDDPLHKKSEALMQQLAPLKTETMESGNAGK